MCAFIWCDGQSGMCVICSIYYTHVSYETRWGGFDRQFALSCAAPIAEHRIRYSLSSFISHAAPTTLPSARHRRIWNHGTRWYLVDRDGFIVAFADEQFSRMSDIPICTSFLLLDCTVTMPTIRLS